MHQSHASHVGDVCADQRPHPGRAKHGDAAPPESGSPGGLAGEEESKAARAVKGGVASLISKFQCQSQVSSFKPVPEKHPRGQGRDQKSAFLRAGGSPDSASRNVSAEGPSSAVGSLRESLPKECEAPEKSTENESSVWRNCSGTRNDSPQCENTSRDELMYGGRNADVSGARGMRVGGYQNCQLPERLVFSITERSHATKSPVPQKLFISFPDKKTQACLGHDAGPGADVPSYAALAGNTKDESPRFDQIHFPDQACGKLASPAVCVDRKTSNNKWLSQNPDLCQTTFQEEHVGDLPVAFCDTEAENVTTASPGMYLTEKITGVEQPFFTALDVPCESGLKDEPGTAGVSLATKEKSMSDRTAASQTQESTVPLGKEYDRRNLMKSKVSDEVFGHGHINSSNDNHPSPGYSHCTEECSEAYSSVMKTEILCLSKGSSSELHDQGGKCDALRMDSDRNEAGVVVVDDDVGEQHQELESQEAESKTATYRKFKTFVCRMASEKDQARRHGEGIFSHSPKSVSLSRNPNKNASKHNQISPMTVTEHRAPVPGIVPGPVPGVVAEKDRSPGPAKFDTKSLSMSRQNASKKQKVFADRKTGAYKVQTCASPLLNSGQSSPRNRRASLVTMSEKVERAKTGPKAAAAGTFRANCFQKNNTMSPARRDCTRCHFRKHSHEQPQRKGGAHEPRTGKKMSDILSSPCSPGSVRQAHTLTSSQPARAGILEGQPQRKKSKAFKKLSPKLNRSDSPWMQASANVAFGTTVSSTKSRPAKDVTVRTYARAGTAFPRSPRECSIISSLQTGEEGSRFTCRQTSNQESSGSQKAAVLSKNASMTSPVPSDALSPRLRKNTALSVGAALGEVFYSSQTDLNIAHTGNASESATGQGLRRDIGACLDSVDAALLSLRATLRPSVVKSDLSAFHSRKVHTTSIRRSRNPARISPSLEIRREISFTKKFRSRSWRSAADSADVSLDLEHRSRRKEQMQAVRAAVAKDGRAEDTSVSTATGTKRCGADGVRRTKLAVLTAEGCHRNLSGRRQSHSMSCDGNRKSTTVEESQGTHPGRSSSRHKRIILPEARYKPETPPLSETLGELANGEEETLSVFRRYGSLLYSGPGEVSQTVTEEARQIKECCIFVKSIEEAESVANSLINSARFDLWSPDKENRTMDPDTCTCDSTGSWHFGESSSRPGDESLHESPAKTAHAGKILEYAKDLARNLCLEAASAETGDDKVRHQVIQTSKWRYFRKPLASVAETNLLDPSSASESGPVCEMMKDIPNVRKIVIQPMICIPLSESNHHLLQVEHCRRQNHSLEQTSEGIKAISRTKIPETKMNIPNKMRASGCMNSHTDAHFLLDISPTPHTTEDWTQSTEQNSMDQIKMIQKTASKSVACEEILDLNLHIRSRLEDNQRLATSKASSSKGKQDVETDVCNESLEQARAVHRERISETTSRGNLSHVKYPLETDRTAEPRLGPVTTDGNWLGPVTTDGNWLGPVTTDGNWLGPVTTDGNWLGPVTTDGNWLRPVTTDGNWLGPVTTDGNWLGPITTDGNLLEPVTTDGNWLEPVITDGNLLGPVTTDGNWLEPVTTDGNLQGPVTTDGKCTDKEEYLSCGARNDVKDVQGICSALTGTSYRKLCLPLDNDETAHVGQDDMDVHGCHQTEPDSNDQITATRSLSEHAYVGSTYVGSMDVTCGGRELGSELSTRVTSLPCLDSGVIRSDPKVSGQAYLVPENSDMTYGASRSDITGDAAGHGDHTCGYVFSPGYGGFSRRTFSEKGGNIRCHIEPGDMDKHSEVITDMSHQSQPGNGHSAGLVQNGQEVNFLLLDEPLHRKQQENYTPQRPESRGNRTEKRTEDEFWRGSSSAEDRAEERETAGNTGPGIPQMSEPSSCGRDTTKADFVSSVQDSVWTSRSGRQHFQVENSQGESSTVCDVYQANEKDKHEKSLLYSQIFEMISKHSHKGDDFKMDISKQSHKEDDLKLDISKQSHKGDDFKMDISKQSHKEDDLQLDISKQRNKGDVLKLDISKQSHKGDDLKMDISKQSHKGDDLKMDISKQSHKEDDLKMDISKQSHKDFDLKLYISKQSHKENDFKIDISKQSHKGDDFKMDISKQSHKENDLKLDISKQSHKGDDFKMDISKQSHKENDLKLDISNQSHKKDDLKIDISKQSHKGDDLKLDVSKQSHKGDDLKLDISNQSHKGDYLKLDITNQNHKGDGLKLDAPCLGRQGDSCSGGKINKSPGENDRECEFTPPHPTERILGYCNHPDAGGGCVLGSALCNHQDSLSDVFLVMYISGGRQLSGHSESEGAPPCMRCLDKREDSNQQEVPLRASVFDGVPSAELEQLPCPLLPPKYRKPHKKNETNVTRTNAVTVFSPTESAETNESNLPKMTSQCGYEHQRGSGKTEDSDEVRAGGVTSPPGIGVGKKLKDYLISLWYQGDCPTCPASREGRAAQEADNERDHETDERTRSRTYMSDSLDLQGCAEARDGSLDVQDMTLLNPAQEHNKLPERTHVTTSLSVPCFTSLPVPDNHMKNSPPDSSFLTTTNQSRENSQSSFYSTQSHYELVTDIEGTPGSNQNIPVSDTPASNIDNIPASTKDIPSSNKDIPATNTDTPASNMDDIPTPSKDLLASNADTPASKISSDQPTDKGTPDSNTDITVATTEGIPGSKIENTRGSEMRHPFSPEPEASNTSTTSKDVLVECGEHVATCWESVSNAACTIRKCSEHKLEACSCADRTPERHATEGVSNSQEQTGDGASEKQELDVADVTNGAKDERETEVSTNLLESTSQKKISEPKEVNPSVSGQADLQLGRDARTPQPGSSRDHQIPRATSSTETGDRPSPRDPGKSPQVLDIEYLYSTLDESADSFNRLFIQNAMYLQDVSSDVAEKVGRHSGPPTVMKRKRSFSKQLHQLQRSVPRPGESRTGDKANQEIFTKNLSKLSASYVDRSLSRLLPPPTRDQCLSRISDNPPAKAAAPKGTSLLCCSERAAHPAGSRERLERASLGSNCGSDLRQSSLGDVSGNFISPTCTQTLTSARNLKNSKLSLEDENSRAHPQKWSTHPATDSNWNESAEVSLLPEEDLGMDSWRRRRLLEKTSNVSGEDLSSWRSRVYQKENSNSSNSNPQLKERRSSYRSETLASVENHTRGGETGSESRRRQSEDSSCSDLSERLARRRAKRLEEKRDSVSQDGSLDSCVSRGRRWSRDGSVRSVDSTESGEHEDRLSSRWSGRHEADTATAVTSGNRRSSRRSSRDSIVSIESLDTTEENTPWTSKRDIDGPNVEMPSLDSKGRKWSSKDSSFKSADSTCSFRTGEEGFGNDRASPLLAGDDAADPGGPSGQGRRLRYGGRSEDSAFSESKERCDLDLNTNNNNDGLVLSHLSDILSSALNKHEAESFVDEFQGTKAALLLSFNGSSRAHEHSSTEEDSVNVSGHVQSSLPCQSPDTTTATVTTAAVTIAATHGRASPEAEESGSATSTFQARLQMIRGGDSDGRNLGAARTREEDHATAPAETTTPSEVNGSFNQVPGNISKTADQKTGTRRRKPRKDKSALRKSKLNMAEDRDKVDVADEDSSSLGSEQGSQDGRARRKPEGSFVSQHASFWENHAPSMHSATPSRERTNVPSRYTGDKEKLTATRQKFMQNSPTTAETSPAQPVRSKMAEASEDTAPKKIARGRTDFNQLLQKFSGSESNSEKSDTDTAAGGPSVGGVPRRRSLVKRQEAKEVVSSSEEADMRKTPERSQSLKVRSRRDDTQSAGSSEYATVSPVVQPAVTSSVEKNSNFRSQFMNKTWAHRNADVSQPLKDTSPPSSGAFSSSLSEEQTMQTLGVGLSSTTSRKHDFGTSVPSTKQSLGTSVPSMKQSLGTFSVTSERQASRQGHTTSASAAKQEHAANISITKNEVAAKTLDGKEEHVRFISSDKQDIAKSISGDKQYIAKSISSDKQDIAKSISSNKQDIAKSISSDKQDIAKSISSDKQDIAKSILSDKQDIAKSVNSIKQEASKSIASAKPEQMSPVRMDRSEKVSYVTMEKPEQVSSVMRDRLEQVSSVMKDRPEQASSITKDRPEQVSSITKDRPEQVSSITKDRPEQMSSITKDRPKQVSSITKDKPEQVSSITKDRPEQMSSVTREKPEQVSSVIREKPEQVSSVTREKPEQVSSVIREKPEQVSSVTREKPEQVSSATREKPEQVSSVTREKPEQVSSVTREKPEQVSSATREKPEQVSSATREKPEQVSSATREKPEQVSSVTREKPEQVSSVTREKPEQVSSVTREKPEQVSSATREKPEQVSSVSASERKHVYSFSDSKEHVTPESTGKQDHMTANKHPHLESEVANEQNKRAPSTGRSEEMKMPCKSDNTSPAPSAETQPKDADVPVPSMARRSPDRGKRERPGSSYESKPNKLVASGAELAHGAAASRHHDVIGLEPEAAAVCKQSSPVDHPEDIRSSFEKPEISPTRSTLSAAPVPTPCTSAEDSHVEKSACIVPGTSSSAPSVVSLSQTSSEQSQPQSGEIRRTSSLKEATLTRTEYTEKRKGILKRNTSLSKQDLAEAAGSSSFPVVDPQLAKILLQRKKVVGDASEALQEAERKEDAGSVLRRSKPLSAAEEIEETLRYSQQQAAQKGLDPDESEGLRRVTVAERIYSMQTKIEEEKYAALTPKSRSGLSTPRSRSGLITPTSQKSFDETVHQRSLTSSSVTESSTTATHQQHQDSDHAALSGSQLMERLSEIAVASERYQERLGEITVATERYQEKLGETAVTSERYQEKLSETAVTSERYQEKPGETAVTSEKYQERRHRYQQRARNDWRHQTQPVTSDEIEAADSLESVSAFRALVRKKHSFNAFDQVRADAAKVAKQQLLAGGKKTEFPQHLAPPPKLSRRNRKLRHMTLPVTAEELKAVPEHQMLVTDPDWVKTEDFIKRDSKTDSGILSGSDADSLYQSESPRSLTLDMDLSDTDPSRMSVTDKASMFRGLEEKTKAERDKEKSASGAKRYINRKKRERSQTMPITEEEVKSASEIGDNKGSGVNSSGKTTPTSPQQPEVVNRSRSNSITEEEDREHVDDDLVKLSLTEKVKLFSQPSEAEKPPVKAEITVVRRRARKMASRFNTQPVTSEEVEKAAASTRISPLAMTMIRPPDPDILKALPLKDQRELMAQHAEMLLSQTSLRSRSGSNASSQPSSRRASVTLEEEEEEEKKDEEEEGTEKGDKKGILKDKSASAKDLHDIRSILKSEPAKAKSESEVHSILKSDVKHVIQCSLVSAREPRGILKKTKSEDASLGVSSDSVKGILKHAEDEDEELQGKPRSRSNSQPLGILKSENASLANEHFLEIKSILRAPSQESVQETPVIKSALRRSSVGSDTPTPGGGGGVLKSALKTRIRNSPDAEEGHIVSAMTSEVSSEKSGRETGHDLNSNNSQRHVPETAEPRADLFDISRSTRLNSATVSSSASSSVIVEVKTSSTTSSSTVTESTATTTQVSAGSSANRGGDGMSASEDGESSSGEILDETPRTTRLKRKSRFSDKSVKTERYRTQPPELTEASSSAAAATSTDTPVRQKYKYEGRHMTQPITPSEMREAEAATPATELTHGSGGSIADRLSKLKTSGEEEWKKRVGKKDEMLISPEVIKLRDKTGMPMPRPNSIADRLNELETSKKNWRERVEETDVKQFTVAGKLANTGATDSPLVSKLKNLPRKEESSSRGSTPLSSPVTPTKEFIAKIPLPRDIVHDPTVSVEIEKKTTVSEETEVRREPVKVEIPVMGEEMEIFFAVKSIEDIQDRVHLEVDDFNNIFIDSEMILSTVRKVRPARKTRPRSANPLKSMSQKLEIRQEYTESFSGVAEKEFKRVKREGLAKDAGFAQAALAGLASTENFKQVELRRTDSGSSGHGQPLDPFAELMLLHVKGRRTVQTRLVEPNTRSINEGDCYILVAQDKVIVWEGRYANVIEKAKASEVANYIQQKKDLGCKRASEVSTVYQAKDFLGAGKVMWTALEGDKQCQACGPDAEDELYESSIVRCNMVYRLEGNALKPYEEYWGALPRYEMLKKNEVIIFDFGTEFYIWQGKAVSMEQRKLGLKLSKQLYEKGYDYTESPINPLSPLRSEDSGGLPLSGPKRPSWTIFGKVNQNMETILFREKFADWPDSSRLIGCKTVGPVETVTKELLELKPFDASRMIAPNTSPVTLKLEGANLGRGVKWSEDMQGFVKEQDIVTLDVTVWHVMEYEHYKLPELSHGQFHDGDTYVVRWQYMITNANLRSLKGSAARNSLTGRERCAYFFWQGNQSTINEKGASALMTVELDEERGPQVRVLQGKEPPCFLNLFGGKMIIHIGKREDPATNTQGAWRLYTVRGDYENEVYLLEIPVSIAHLRSRSSLILLNVRTGILYIWHGAKSPKHVRELCIKVVGRLKESMPLEIGLHEKANLMAIEVEEGEEKREIWSALDGRDRSIYHSLLTDPRPYTHTVRLFHMSSVNLVFEVHEQLNPSRVPDLTTAFPFLQSDLYKAAQPALFLLDNDHEVYLWQGWWPVGSHDTENVQTGSALARFNLDRRLAMETTLHYCREKSSSRPAKAYLVCAGLEPVCFTTLFPYWEEDTIVKDIAVQEGKSLGYMEPISDILHRLTETRYSLAELQERPLPEGVDPLRLESYLDDAEFEEILEMNRDEFYAQPHWKQIDMKKHVGLF